MHFSFVYIYNTDQWVSINLSYGEICIINIEKLKYDNLFS